jgi:hypothetical protein
MSSKNESFLFTGKISFLSENVELIVNKIS